MPEPMTLGEALQILDSPPTSDAERYFVAVRVAREMLRATIEAPTLAQRREGVTAAMVEAACVAMFQWWKLSTTTHADRELARLDMRAALTAALGARDGGAD